MLSFTDGLLLKEGTTNIGLEVVLGEKCQQQVLLMWLCWLELWQKAAFWLQSYAVIHLVNSQALRIAAEDTRGLWVLACICVLSM